MIVTVSPFLNFQIKLANERRAVGVKGDLVEQLHQLRDKQLTVRRRTNAVSQEVEI